MKYQKPKLHSFEEPAATLFCGDGTNAYSTFHMFDGKACLSGLTPDGYLYSFSCFSGSSAGGGPGAVCQTGGDGPTWPGCFNGSYNDWPAFGATGGYECITGGAISYNFFPTSACMSGDSAI